MTALTLQDVADRAGVSLATASRVLNGSVRTPRPDVVERVRRAADELGYVANAYAQALATSATKLIGLVVHDIADPYFSSIARGVQLAARRHERHVLLANTDRDPAVERDAVRALVSYRAEAIILAGSRRSTANDSLLSADLDRYRRNGGRVAVIGQRLQGARAVLPENTAGAADLAEALLADGHRRFAVLAGPEALLTAGDRHTGFVGALRNRGLDPVQTLTCEFTRDGGFDAATRLIRDQGLAPGEGPPLCVFAVNDVMAIGAIAAFRDAGLRVPQDVQVAGFGDIPTLRDHVPGLTTVRLPLAELGERAVALAVGDDPESDDEIPVSGKVIRRESTRLPDSA